MNDMPNNNKFSSGPKGPSHFLPSMIWHDRSKWEKFGVILLVLVFVSAAASLVARSAFFSSNYNADVRIAVIAPLSGPNAELGQSLLRGAQTYVQTLNESGGLNGTYAGLMVLDNKGEAALSAKLAEEAVADEGVLAIVGPWQSEAIATVATVAQRAGVAVVTPSPQFGPQENGQVGSLGVFRLTYDAGHETRFLANYMRNILQEKLVSVVVDTAGATAIADEFTKAFERFGIPLRHRWEFNSGASDTEARLSRIADEIKAASDAGAVYFAMNGAEAASLVSKMRERRAVNRIVGPHTLSSVAFAEGFAGNDQAQLTHGIYTSAPLIFDTANQKVQSFRSRYLQDFKMSPDWVAAYGYEAANVVGTALDAIFAAGETSVADQIRSAVVAHLERNGQDGRGVSALTGVSVFGPDRSVDKPVQIGIYNGKQIVSAPTQLQPIEPGEIDNYIEAVRQGRALYVNDRFMYRTNVVYAGLLIEKLSNYDPKDHTIEMDAVVWFRYRGNFDPQDIVFNNAVKPVEMSEPEHAETIGDLNYRRYRISARFETDFLDVPRNYGSKLIGTSFHHKLLNKNNLIYVVDVVGVGLTDGGTYLDGLKSSNAMGPALGLVPERAWISQEIVRISGQGDPNFAGHGKPAPDFSRLEAGVVAVDGTVSLSDLVPEQYLIYISIFAFLGSVFAKLMDRKREGRKMFWSLQSWLLRFVCWPLLLASAGSLVLNIAFQNLEFFYVDLIVPVYESLWWIIGALLLTMAVTRFVWTPLESSTDRKVPGSIKAFASVVIYLLATFGVIAFVLHQELTSLLATSGLLAMVIGLAIQANIANIFSGIVLNMERPFNVGDVIKVDDELEGIVTDISWRTTRAVDYDGKLHCIPNAKATESNLVRICKSSGEPYYISENVYVTPKSSPEVVNAALNRAMDSTDGIDRHRSPPTVKMKDMVLSNGVPYLKYRIWYSAAEYGNRHNVQDDLWRAIARELEASGMAFSQVPRIAPGMAQ